MQQPPVFRLEDYRPTPYAIPAVRLAFDLHPTATRVKAELEIARRPNVAAGTPLVLDGNELKLVAVAVDGVPLGHKAYHAAPDRLEIFAPPAGPFTLEIITEINPDKNRSLMGLYRSGGVFCTQCEAEGFRRITYFYDRPDVLATYTVRLTADKTACPVLLANGNRQETGDLPEGRHFAVWHDPHPKPSYLFACVGGALEALSDRFIAADGKKVELHIYTEPGKTARALYAMDSLKRAFAWDEAKFGRLYDLDIFNIVAVSDFNMGAMENKGLNIFNDKYVLADPQTATDSDYADIERVIAHEYFHNWSGNRITCRDWFQLCLKEGLTVYRDQEFSSDERSRPVQRLIDAAFLTTTQFAEDAGPLAHPVRPRRYAAIDNFYTATVYEKGAELVRMIACLLGEQEFQAGMTLYFTRHDGQACTIEDFIQCFAESSGRNFSRFMLWYEQAGTPQVKADYAYNAGCGSFTLTLEQSLAPTAAGGEAKPMTIPVRFGLVGSDGKDMACKTADKAVQGDVLLLTQAKQIFHFTGLDSRPVPSLLRGFSAPVRLVTSLSRQERLFLAAYDSDLVNRYQMLRGLLIETLIEAGGAANKANAAGPLPAVSFEIAAAQVQMAENEALEPAFRALCLHLPSEAEIAAAQGSNVNPDAIFAARQAFLHILADTGKTRFLALRQHHNVTSAFSPNAFDAGKRAFTNILAEYIAIADNDPEIAAALYTKAGNMTEKLAGLRLLTLYFPTAAATKQALADFEQRFAHEALVMDKWFALQASAAGTDRLETIRQLTRHKLFSYDNPNRVRALIGSFVTQCQTGFHRADGASYRFLAEVILRIDKNNPQLAARLLSFMRSWTQLEQERRSKMQAALQYIAEGRALSRDVSDIVNRLLGKPGVL
ncbi:aminopeptidase N [Candidatus Tokpelaia sp.]|nr:aminopeptidase N [Candidatus Tokpelaia sp.]